MIWGIISCIIVILDQISKKIIYSKIFLGDSITIIDKFFYIIHTKNKGAAWGIMQNGRLVFIFVTIISCIFLIYYLFKIKNKIFCFSISFILGGAIGNLIDRIYIGSVIDFIDIYIGDYNFPTFNIADSSIVVGTCILIYYIIFIYKDSNVEKVK